MIQNAKVYTLSSQGTLDRASVVVVDGKITQVGKTVKVPTGAQIIKAEGLEIYPGMVNAWGNIGLTEIGSVEVMSDTTTSALSNLSCWHSAPCCPPANTFRLHA